MHFSTYIYSIPPNNRAPIGDVKILLVSNEEARLFVFEVRQYTLSFKLLIRKINISPESVKIKFLFSAFVYCRSTSIYSSFSPSAGPEIL